jgi:hypothetical protein
MLSRMWRKRNTPSLLVGFHADKTTWMSVRQFLRIFNVVLPEDPALRLLGIHPIDTPIYNKDTCSIMFKAAFFIIARRWKEQRCPSTENGYRKCGTFTQWSTTQLLKK